MIIAEIGQNWCGKPELARQLIELAKENGADLAKFQLYDSKKLYGEKQNTELTFQQASDAFYYGKRIGIEVFFSVFDVERVKWCEEIGVKRYKIAYSQNDNAELISMLEPTYKSVMISVDWNAYASHFKQYIHDFRNKVILLYCEPTYPAVSSELKLDSIDFGEEIDGFSDHTIGLDCAKIALARGAEIIEKHFAIDHKTGVDAEWSMDASELRELKRWESVIKQLS